MKLFNYDDLCNRAQKYKNEVYEDSKIITMDVNENRKQLVDPE